MVEYWQDLPRSWQDYGRVLVIFWQDLGTIMLRSGQDLPRSWQDYDKIIARLWQDLDKNRFQDLVGILTRSSKIMQDCDRILARSNMEKQKTILVRSWQEFRKILPRFVLARQDSIVLPRSSKDLARISVMVRSCHDHARSYKILPRCSTWKYAACEKHTAIICWKLNELLPKLIYFWNFVTNQ